MKRKNEGITLIALIITIIVLIILAGVTINMVIGNNGIFTQTQKAKIKTEQSNVYEAMQLQVSDYEIEKNTEGTTDTLVNYIKSKNIINDNNVINVQELLKKQISTGQGTDNKDVYVLEENENGEYVVVYYDKNGEKLELGILGKKEEEVADENLFIISLDGEILLNWKYGNEGYYDDIWEDWKIENLIIPDYIHGIRVTSIGNNFLNGNNKIKSIKLPDGVTKIGQDAFKGCNSLRKINIPEGLTDIIEYRLGEWKLLEQIDVSENNPSYSSKDGVLFDKTGTTIKFYPTGKKVDTYQIPESVTNIGRGAFSMCVSLRNISIPDGITNIDSGAFSTCVSLQNINIPDSVTNIGEFAFAGCLSLQSINIPESVINIGTMSFKSCISLNNIDVSEDNPNYSSKDGVLFDKTGKELIYFPMNKKTSTYQIPEETQKISSGAFALQVDDENEFKNQINLMLQSILPKEQAEAIAEKIENPTLNKVIIPANVTEVEEGAFVGGGSNSTIKVPFASEAERPSGWSENWNKDCQAIIEYTK